MVGRTLSHYKVLEELSRGGMGIVYGAFPEAKAAAKLNHG